MPTSVILKTGGFWSRTVLRVQRLLELQRPETPSPLLTPYPVKVIIIVIAIVIVIIVLVFLNSFKNRIW